MINQFLQAGGVRDLDEFYEKFPTEEHFNNYMKYGGGLHSYQVGGPPSQEDQEGDLHSLSLNNNVAQPFVGPMIPAYAQNMGTSTIDQQPSHSYNGNSIADFFRAYDMDGSLAARKNFFGNDYTGTADQNNENLAALQAEFAQNNSIPGERIGVNNPRTKTNTTKKAPVVPFSQPMVGGPQLNTFQNTNGLHNMLTGTGPISVPTAPSNKPIDNVKNAIKSSDGKNVNEVIIGVTSLVAAGGIGIFDLYQTIDALENSKWTGNAKGKLTKAINNLRTKALAEASAKVKKEVALFEKLPKRAQKMYLNFNDPQNLEMLTPQLSPELSRINLNTHNALNYPGARTEASIAAYQGLQPDMENISEEQKIINRLIANKRKTKANFVNRPYTDADLIMQEEVLPSWIRNAGKKLGQNLFKFLRKEEGGQTDDSGTYSNGVYYQQGGNTNGYYKSGGSNQWGGQFQEGGEYELSNDEIQNLIDQGYKIEYL